MKLTTIAVATAAIFACVHCAQARGHRYHHFHRRLSPVQEGSGDTAPAEALSARSKTRGRHGGRPAAWCGWEMRQLVASDPGPAFNLARNWAHWGESGPAGVGAVVVWSHHVGKIVGRQGGMWVVQSGNDGHALRSRARSIAGAIAIRWG